MNKPNNNSNPNGPQSVARGATSVQFWEVKPAALLRLLSQALDGLVKQGVTITSEVSEAGLTLTIPGVTRNEKGALVIAETVSEPV